MKIWKEKPEAWKEIRPGVFNRVMHLESFGSVSLVRFKKGTTYPLHKGGVDHWGILMQGTGVLDIGTQKIVLRAGDSYFIKPEDDHGFTNTSNDDAIMMEIFVPPREGSSAVSQKPEPV